ncbi:MAG: hypothetical protein DYG94_10310 [Leptolyngbya sp. PLA3]|nr:MAG: hypothetical protein EDM82_09725 [Cyanobacteria bacterium CYA]MCE7969123.1 hypothetical protein [Leptolyngbya sp. PL-A3]
MWDCAELTDAIARGIAQAEEALRREQAVLGLDARDEVSLHPLVAAGLGRLGLTVLREQAYPGAYARRPRPRDRERCDLVALPPGADGLLDPLALLKRPEPTLFAAVEEPEPRPALPEDAFWLEVKSVAQVCYVEGVPMGNTSYASQLIRGPALDLAKLAREPMIDAGGSLVLLFGASGDVVRHDLGVMTRALIDRDLPISSPSMDVVPIADRAGNACVGVCLVPLRAVRDR